MKTVTGVHSVLFSQDSLQILMNYTVNCSLRYLELPCQLSLRFRISSFDAILDFWELFSALLAFPGSSAVSQPSSLPKIPIFFWRWYDERRFWWCWYFVPWGCLKFPVVNILRDQAPLSLQQLQASRGEAFLNRFARNKFHWIEHTWLSQKTTTNANKVRRAQNGRGRAQPFHSKWITLCN